MERALRILVLDDSEDDVKLMERVLRAGDVYFSLERVETREAFERALAEDPDVILVDYRLPHFDGLAALRLAKARRPEVPVLVVTGSLSDELAAEFVQEGASDYIIKDRRSRLALAVRRAVEETRLRLARLEAEAKYRALFLESREGIALVDCASGRILECNQAFERQAGRAAAQLEGTLLWELAAPAEQASVRRAFEAEAADAQRWDVRAHFRRPDGTDLAVEVSASVVVLPGRRYAQIFSRERAGSQPRAA